MIGQALCISTSRAHFTLYRVFSLVTRICAPHWLSWRASKVLRRWPAKTGYFMESTYSSSLIYHFVIIVKPIMAIQYHRESIRNCRYIVNNFPMLLIKYKNGYHIEIKSTCHFDKAFFDIDDLWMVYHISLIYCLFAKVRWKLYAKIVALFNISDFHSIQRRRHETKQRHPRPSGRHPHAGCRLVGVRRLLGPTPHSHVARTLCTGLAVWQDTGAYL